MTKLIVEFEPATFEFDVTEEEYAEFLADGNVYSYFDAYISDVSPEFSARIVN